MSVSYGIVQKHGGNILIDSSEGKGTLVRVFLPLEHAMPADEVPGISAEDNFREKKLADG